MIFLLSYFFDNDGSFFALTCGLYIPIAFGVGREFARVYFPILDIPLEVVGYLVKRFAVEIVHRVFLTYPAYERLDMLIGLAVSDIDGNLVCHS